jgi:hypothetical protein
MAIKSTLGLAACVPIPDRMSNIKEKIRIPFFALRKRRGQGLGLDFILNPPRLKEMRRYGEEGMGDGFDEKVSEIISKRRR